MECQYCGKTVTAIWALTDSPYCREDHRWTHLEELNRLGLAFLVRQVCGEQLGDLSGDLGPVAGFFASACLPPNGDSPLDPNTPEALAIRRLSAHLDRSSS